LAFFGISSLLRLARAGYILAREGVFVSIDPQLAPPVAALPLRLANLIARKQPASDGLALVRALTQIGPSYVKLGQFLATRPDIVGGEIADALSQLQDRMAPFGQEAAIAIVEKSLGKKITGLFVDFGPPVAAASVAQVHRAIVLDRGAERWSSEARRLRLIEVVDTLARSVKLETDFRLEAAAASEFSENIAQDPEMRAPYIDWDRTARDVLTLEWIEGVPLSDPKGVAAAGHDFKTVGRTVLQSFLRQAMRDGFFHADMHQGNLFIDASGRLVAIDFGIMGRLGLKERRFLAEILYGLITRNYRRVAEVHFEAGYVPMTHSVEEFSQALRAIGEPMHTMNASDISMARVLTLLFEVTSLFDMRTRTELVLLQRTMVVAEGVARAFDPQLDVWKTCDPVVRSWIEENLGPKAKIEDAGKTLADLARLASHLPKTLTAAEVSLTRISQHGFDLSPEALKDLAQTRRTSDYRLIIGAGFLLIFAAWLFR
jgi:ubiquinone biosynthesis protein